MFLVIGIKWISHAPLICRKILARLQNSIYLLIASILTIYRNKYFNRQKQRKENAWSISMRDQCLQGTEMTYCIWCMASSLNCIYCIKCIVRKWHLHKISLQCWETKMRSLTIIMFFNFSRLTINRNKEWKTFWTERSLTEDHEPQMNTNLNKVAGLVHSYNPVQFLWSNWSM